MRSVLVEVVEGQVARWNSRPPRYSRRTHIIARWYPGAARTYCGLTVGDIRDTGRRADCKACLELGRRAH